MNFLDVFEDFSGLGFQILPPQAVYLPGSYFDSLDFAGYYNETLKYLGCEEAELLTKSRDESKTYAAKLIVAAMLGENLYDFGILVSF